MTGFSQTSIESDFSIVSKGKNFRVKKISQIMTSFPLRSVIISYFAYTSS